MARYKCIINLFQNAPISDKVSNSGCGWSSLARTSSPPASSTRMSSALLTKFAQIVQQTSSLSLKWRLGNSVIVHTEHTDKILSKFNFILNGAGLGGVSRYNFSNVKSN